MVATFIPKENQDLPDSYGLTIYYANGKQERLELASHKVTHVVRIPDPEGPYEAQDIGKFRFEPAPCPMLELVTKDDLWSWIPLTLGCRFEFDKNFSKIVAIKEEMAKKV